MGRPLSKQQLFGANAKDNIKVQFYNGTASVPGFIVEQTGSKRFVCEDADGIRRTCYLVDKASADLGYKEMTISFKNDDGTVQQAKKISRHRISLMYDGELRSFPWNFSTSTTDGYWQVEEAGTDNQLTDATDLEEDDAPPFNLLTDYPVPGSGTLTPAGSLGLPGYNAVGSPGEPSGSILNAATSGYGVGLRRNKFTGNFTTNATSAPNTWNYTWFIDNSSNVIAGAEVFDTFGGFGYQLDQAGLGGSLFSLESKGWIKAPISQTYNFYGRSDDHMAIWIGGAAQTGNDDTNAVLAGHGGRIDPNVGVTLDAGKWYPIRIWFSEHTGGCQTQFYAVGSLSGQQFGSTDFAFKYNPQGEGW